MRRKRNQRDILTYVRANWNCIGRTRREAEILEEERVNTASGVFQWGALVDPLMHNLYDSGKSLKVNRKELLTVPTELHELYQNILIAIEKRDLPQSLRLVQ